MKDKKSETERTKKSVNNGDKYKNIALPPIKKTGQKKEEIGLSDILRVNSQEVVNSAILVDRYAQRTKLIETIARLKQADKRKQNQNDANAQKLYDELFTEEFRVYCARAKRAGYIKETQDGKYLQWCLCEKQKGYLASLAYFLYKIFGEGVQWKKWESIFRVKYLKQSYKKNGTQKWRKKIDTLFF